MKIWIGLIIAAIAGLGFGLGLTQYEFAGVGSFLRVSNTHVPESVDENSPETKVSTSDVKRPRAKIIGDSVYEFGTIEQDTKDSHVFKLKNEGNAPLKLVITGTTCKCTVGKLETDSIPPGEIAEIELTYEAKQPTAVYRHGATIRTNDPDHPTIKLSVSGVVENRIYVLPTTIVLSRISSNSPTEFQLSVFSVRHPEFDVTDVVFTNSEIAEFFEFDVAPLPADMFQGSADGGKLVTVRTKPGLPNGPFRQDLRVETNSGKPLFVPFTGSVIADVSIAGGVKFNSDASLFDMGLIERGKGAEARLLVLVKGENRDKINVKVAGSSPSTLKAELGEPTRGKKVTRYPLKLTVPPDSPSGSYLGSKASGFGKVILETTDPRNKELTVRVRFAIE